MPFSSHLIRGSWHHPITGAVDPNHSLMWRLLATFNFFSAVKLLFFPFPTLLTGRRSLTQTTLTGGMLGCTLGKDEHQRTYGHRLKPQESLINILGDTLSLCNDLLVPKSPLR